jgi:hypothetical protein
LCKAGWVLALDMDTCVVSSMSGTPTMRQMQCVCVCFSPGARRRLGRPEIGPAQRCACRESRLALRVAPRSADASLRLYRFYGATRRDRTGDLLITKFRVSVYVSDPVFGVGVCTMVFSAWSARNEPDFEPNFGCPVASALGQQGCERNEGLSRSFVVF